MFGKFKYYNLKNILKINAQYNIIFGERSNGKTYASLLYGLKRYVEKGEQFAYIRRWKEDFIGKRGQTLFNSIISNGEVEKLTKGVYNSIYYYNGRWFLCRIENGKRTVSDDVPFCYGFSIASTEHDKSTSYPNIKTIIFDEFLTRKFYLPDEFIHFMNCLSTIIRDRDDVKIFMLGNTVSQYCPYFSEMGLKHIKNMKMGEIAIYSYGEKGQLKIAVEYCKPNKEGKKSDLYFAFDNPKLQMITKGIWELDIYPHCPTKYTLKDILLLYFIDFDNTLLQCEIINKGDEFFTFIHPKTTEIKDNTSLIYTTKDIFDNRYKKNITRPNTKQEYIIYEFFKQYKVYYSNNEVGEVVKNYIAYCMREL